VLSKVSQELAGTLPLFCSAAGSPQRFGVLSKASQELVGTLPLFCSAAGSPQTFRVLSKVSQELAGTLPLFCSAAGSPQRFGVLSKVSQGLAHYVCFCSADCEPHSFMKLTRHQNKMVAATKSSHDLPQTISTNSVKSFFADEQRLKAGLDVVRDLSPVFSLYLP